jgi:hypothetical protein
MFHHCKKLNRSTTVRRIQLHHLQDYKRYSLIFVVNFLGFHIVIDRVDDLPPKSQSEMIKFFQLSSAARRVKIIFSSRPHLDKLEKTFRGLSVEVKPQIEDIRSSIRAWIKGNNHL